MAALPNSIALVLVVQMFGAAAEELGWRGIVQPLFETRIGMMRAMIATGLLFGAGHSYVESEGLPVYLLFVVGATAMSVIFGISSVGRSIFGRTIVATMAHWFVNVVLLLLFSDGDSSAVWMAQSAAASMIVAGFCAYRLSTGTSSQVTVIATRRTDN